MKGAAARLRQIGKKFISVQISKRARLDSELSQWHLWHEAGHVIDDVHVIRLGRHEWRTSKHAEAFRASLNREQIEALASFSPIEVTYTAKFGDGRKVTYSSKDEIAADESIPRALRLNILVKFGHALMEMQDYRRTSTELFAEAFACYMLRRDYFAANFPQAFEFLEKLNRVAPFHC